MKHPGLTSKWDSLSRNEIRWLQGKKLSRFIQEQVYPFSSFYREHFDKAGVSPSSIKTLDDLRRLPFISKVDCCASKEDPARSKKLVLAPTADSIRKNFSPLRLAKMAVMKAIRGEEWIKKDLGREYRPSMLIFTTGRTSDPVPFALTLYDLEIMKEVGSRILSVIGADPATDRCVSVFPYAPHLAFWQVFYCGMTDGLMSLLTGGGRVMSTDRILGSIEKLKPTLISGIPGYVYHLLRNGAEQGRDFSSIRLILLGGDRVTDHQRRRITEILEQQGSKDPQVLSVYGFTEARQCFAECPAKESTGFHTYPDLSIFETIDPETGEPVADGEPGELVYTGIDGRGTIAIRYRTGDIAEGGLTYDPCPHCGRNTPRIMGPMSRVSNQVGYQLSKIKGTLVNLDHISQIVGDQRGVEEWQLVIGKKNDDPMEVDELTLYLAAEERANESTIRQQIQQRLRAETEVGLNGVHFLPLPDMLDRIGMETELKENRVVDRRKEIEGRIQKETQSQSKN